MKSCPAATRTQAHFVRAFTLFWVAGCALTACAPTDPCNEIDLPRCEATEGCTTFTALELGAVPGSSGWCIPGNAVAADIACVTAPTDCRGGTAYASPADDNGDATDACFSYAGCEPPLGWVACEPDVELTIAECPG
jgi:hypothetical protein